MKNKIIIGIVFIGLISFGIYYFFNSTKDIKNYPSTGTDVIAFGDSLVEGVGATEGNDFVSALSKKIGRPIANLGHSGDTTANGIARLSDLDDYDPEVVILLLGGNDYLKRVPIEETRKNLAYLIENIQNRGAVVLLVAVRGGVLTDHFSKEYKDLRDTYDTAYASDILDGLLGRPAYMSDAIHPNDIGYGMIADRIYPVLLKLIR